MRSKVHTKRVTPLGPRATRPRVTQLGASEELFAERYRLLDVVGRGGSAQVWAATDVVTGQQVAVKVVAAEAFDGEVARARFEREAELATQLRGPHFVEVYGYGVCEDGAWLAMELLRGESLHRRIEVRGAFSVVAVRDLLRGVARALRVAHALQIVHRDIKPGNIFFSLPQQHRSGVQTIDGTLEVVKLLDFGIAKDPWDQQRLTRPDMVLGSLLYMSPEQIRASRDVDTRTDLWSLAVILYITLTAKRPFGSQPALVFGRILNDPAPPPSSFRGDLGSQLDDFFVKGLAKNPAERFQTVDEMLESFESAAADSMANARGVPTSAALPEPATPDDGASLPKLQDDIPTVVYLPIVPDANYLGPTSLRPDIHANSTSVEVQNDPAIEQEQSELDSEDPTRKLVSQPDVVGVPSAVQLPPVAELKWAFDPVQADGGSAPPRLAAFRRGWGVWLVLLVATVVAYNLWTK